MIMSISLDGSFHLVKACLPHIDNTDTLADLAHYKTKASFVNNMNKRSRNITQADMEAEIGIEERRQAFVELNAANTRTLAEAESIVRAGRQARRIVKCGFNHRHHPPFRQVRAWVDAQPADAPLRGQGWFPAAFESGSPRRDEARFAVALALEQAGRPERAFETLAPFAGGDAGELTPAE